MYIYVYIYRSIDRYPIYYLLQVSNWRGGAVRVDVVNLLLAADLVRHGDGQPHAVLPADARGSHHVVAVRVGSLTERRDRGYGLSWVRGS